MRVFGKDERGNSVVRAYKASLSYFTYGKDIDS